MNSEGAKSFAWATALGGILLVLITVITLAPRFSAPGSPQDEGLLLVYPERILAGAIPNRDFEHLYGPGNLWLLAAGSKILGASITVERTFGLVYRVAIVLAVFMIGRPRSVGVGLASGLLAVIFVNPHLSAYAWFAGVGLALWGLWLLAQGKPSRHRVLAFATAGVMSGLALLFRVDFAPAIMLSSLPLLHLATRMSRYAWLLGVLFGVSLYALHLALATPLSVFDGMFIDPVVHISPGRRLPLPPADVQAGALFFLVIAAASLLLATGFLETRRHPTSQLARTTLAIGLFSLGLLPATLQRGDATHLMYAAIGSLAFLPLALSSAFSLIPVRFRPRLGQAAAIALSGLVVVLAAPGLAVGPTIAAGLRTLEGEPDVSYPVVHDGRTFPLQDPAVASHLELLLWELDQRASPGDTVFVGPSDLRLTNHNDTFIYFLLPKLTPATYFLEMNPGSANRGASGLADDIASATWLILTTRYDDWREPNASWKPGSEQAPEVVSSLFCTVAEHGSYELLARCGTPRAESQRAGEGGTTP